MTGRGVWSPDFRACWGERQRSRRGHPSTHRDPRMSYIVTVQPGRIHHTLSSCFFRYTSILGDGLRACSPAGRGTEVVLACHILNQMTGLGRPMCGLGCRQVRRSGSDQARKEESPCQNCLPFFSSPSLSLRSSSALKMTPRRHLLDQSCSCRPLKVATHPFCGKEMRHVWMVKRARRGDHLPESRIPTAPPRP